MSGRAAGQTVTARASADLLIDRERLSTLLGRQVRTTRLRFKPGLSTSAVLLTAGQDDPGWIQVSHPGHTDKLRKAVELAGERGQQVHVLQDGELTLAHGTIDTDPRLQKGLDALRPVHASVSEAVAAGRLSVLRYNPQRRLVLRRDVTAGDPLVLRVTAEKQVGVHASLRDLAAAGVPVVEPVRDDVRRRSRRVTVWPWFGQGDLATVDASVVETAGPAAGAALARLHGSAVAAEPVLDTVVALSRQVWDVVDLDPGAGERLHALTAAVAERIGSGRWATGHVHGDFSADQVLVGRDHEDPVRLTDFDRSGRARLAGDLGSFAAAELLAGSREGDQAWPGVDALPLTRAMLAGYTQAGGAGQPLTDPDLRTWVARALLTRVTEPFRAADPDWLAGIHRRLDQVQAVLG